MTVEVEYVTRYVCQGCGAVGGRWAWDSVCQKCGGPPGSNWREAVYKIERTKTPGSWKRLWIPHVECKISFHSWRYTRHP
jgi:hypothetical protein